MSYDDPEDYISKVRLDERISELEKEIAELREMIKNRNNQIDMINERKNEQQRELNELRIKLGSHIGTTHKGLNELKEDIKNLFANETRDLDQMLNIQEVLRELYNKLYNEKIIGMPFYGLQIAKLSGEEKKDLGIYHIESDSSKDGWTEDSGEEKKEEGYYKKYDKGQMFFKPIKASGDEKSVKECSREQTLISDERADSKPPEPKYPTINPFSLNENEPSENSIKEIVYVSSRGTSKYRLCLEGVIEFLENHFPTHKIVKREDLLKFKQFFFRMYHDKDRTPYGIREECYNLWKIIKEEYKL